MHVGHRRVSGIIAAVVLALGGAARAEVSGSEVRAVAVASDALACDLYHHLKPGNPNLAFSPFALSTSLAMTSLGARGKTAADFAKTLHHPETPHLHTIAGGLAAGFTRAKDFTFSMDNQLWTPRSATISPDFSADLKRYYRAATSPADLADAEKARTDINAAVAKSTGERIKELLPAAAIAPDTRLLVTSAATFRAAWENPFLPQHTVTGDFHLSSDRKVNASMMHDTRELPAAQTPEYQAVELPYKGKRVALLLLVPREGKTLADVEKRLSPTHLRDLAANLVETRVALTMPRFKVASRLSVAPALTTLGMPADANLAGLADASLSAVEHGAAFEVTEDGSDPAAPAAGAAKTFSDERPTRVVLDRPFIWMVIERNSRMIFMMGRVTDPTR